MNPDDTASKHGAWFSLELVVVIGLVVMSLFVGSTLAVVAYTHGFTALPAAVPQQK